MNPIIIFYNIYVKHICASIVNQFKTLYKIDMYGFFAIWPKNDCFLVNSYCTIHANGV